MNKAVLKAIAEQAETNYPLIEEKLRGQPEKEIFMEGIYAALIIVHGLNLFNEAE